VRRYLAIAALLGGCDYFDDDAGPSDPPPDGPPPIHELPAGVWEPVPGAWIYTASVAADSDTVWWAFAARTGPVGDQRDNWLGATSSTGTSIVAPTHVAPTSVSSYRPDVVVTPSAVVTKFGGTTTLLRRYDRAGTPLGDPYPIAIENGGTALAGFGQTDLVPTADGGVQFVAALSSYALAEAAIVDLDASGTPAAPLFVGTPDTFETVQSSAYGVAAAARADGSTLIAWDRSYVVCIPVRPSSTLTTVVTGTTVGAIQSVQDIPDVGAARPSIASSGTTAYVTWQIEASGRNRIALAKFPDVATVLAEIGDPNENNYEAALTLAGPGRGAVMYRSGGFAGKMMVVGFAESAGTVKLGVPRVIPQVDPDANPMAIGLVHVGGDRYVFGWIEHDTQARLYATEIDLGNEMMRPAPMFELGPAPATGAQRKLPCP
jgi:hypothetical protein